MPSCTPFHREAAHSNAQRLRGGTSHLLAAKTHFWPRWHLPRYDSCTVHLFPENTPKKINPAPNRCRISNAAHLQKARNFYPPLPASEMQIRGSEFRQECPSLIGVLESVIWAS